MALGTSADTLKVARSGPLPKPRMNKGCFSCVSLLMENSRHFSLCFYHGNSLSRMASFSRGIRPQRERPFCDTLLYLHFGRQDGRSVDSLVITLQKRIVCRALTKTSLILSQHISSR